MKTIAKRGMFLEKNDECPTCEQPIQNKDKLITETKNEAYQVQTSLSVVENGGASIDTKISSLEDVIASIRKKTDTINVNNREIVSLKNNIVQKILEGQNIFFSFPIYFDTDQFGTIIY